jgi:CHAT domain-containing protein
VTPPLSIQVDIAPGELIDKITILQIKSERITDAAKLENVRTELETLTASRDSAIAASDALTSLSDELKAINEELWEIEDAIRDCERSQDFGETFIGLARAVYRTNDRRADVKRRINDLLGAAFSEEKSYAAY